MYEQRSEAHSVAVGAQMKFHQDGTLPQNGEVWVFGSNLAGAHGAGAAKVALEKFGAEYGFGIGRVGDTYAIPTKGIALEVLSIDQITPHIRVFLDYAWTSKRQFFVTRIGCGLAGYTDADIAPLFKGAPANCSFATEWRKYL